MEGDLQRVGFGEAMGQFVSNVFEFLGSEIVFAWVTYDFWACGFYFYLRFYSCEHHYIIAVKSLPQHIFSELKLLSLLCRSRERDRWRRAHLSQKEAHPNGPSPANRFVLYPGICR